MASITYRYQSAPQTFQANVLMLQLASELVTTPKVLVSMDGSSAIVTIDESITADQVNAVIFQFYGLEYSAGGSEVTLQVIASGSDGTPLIYYDNTGKFYASSFELSLADLVINSLGISINAPTGSEFDTFLYWKNAGVIVAELLGGVIDGDVSGIQIKGKAKTSSEVGSAALVARDHNDSDSTDAVLAIFSDGGLVYNYRNSSLQTVHRGHVQTYTKIATTTETQGIGFTIPAGAMGANSVVTLRGKITVFNNKGSPGTASLIFYFGSKSYTFQSAVAVANSAVNKTIWIIEIQVKNAGSTAVQEIVGRFERTDDVPVETNMTPAATRHWRAEATEDTVANNTDCKVNVDLSATDASFYAECAGALFGPYG